MTSRSANHISRRDFIKIAGGTAFAVAGATFLPQFLRKTLLLEQGTHLGGVQGVWITLRGSDRN